MIMETKPFKLKKAHLVYFVIKETTKRMDYRFNYERTPESAIKYQLGQWHRDYDGKLKRHIFPHRYDSRIEAEAIMSKYNRELFEKIKYQGFELA